LFGLRLQINHGLTEVQNRNLVAPARKSPYYIRFELSVQHEFFAGWTTAGRDLQLGPRCTF
jgi:hypothetical protein